MANFFEKVIPLKKRKNLSGIVMIVRNHPQSKNVEEKRDIIINRLNKKDIKPLIEQSTNKKNIYELKNIIYFADLSAESE